MNSFNWFNYNNNVKLLKKLSNLNKKNKFNFIEKGIYNHVRDIFCLSLFITQSRVKRTKIKVLDYGSNSLAYVNLVNKINTKSFNFNICDLFYKNNKRIKKKDLNFFSNQKKLKNNWDMINFGSSLQYLKNLKLLNKINFKRSKVVLITHTPISIGKSYISKQINNKGLFQNIHSISNIKNLMKKNNLKLIFKSRNEDKYVSAIQKQKTYSLNLLFVK